MRPPVGAPTLTRRTRILLVVAGLLVLLLLGGSRLINFYVDWLWFGEVDFRNVLTTVLFTRIVQFLVGALLMGGLVALSLWIAYRSRPVFVPVSGPEDPIARYRTLIIQRLRLFAIGVPVAIGVISGLAVQGDWQTVQMFLNSTPFGVTDPEFGIDVSFYAFQLPFYRYVLDWLFIAVAVSFIVALITHYIFGGIRLTGRAGQVSTAARAQLAVLAGVFVLLKAVAYYLDRYELLYSSRSDLFTGATYTDLNAVMPAKLILLFISVICAAAFFAAVFRRNLQLPAIATVLLVLSSVLVGAAWPAVLQQFIVAPNADAREALSIERNIAATRQAFGLTDDKVEEIPYGGAANEVSPVEVANDSATVPNIRLLDPAKVSDTFTQLQQRRTFYGFQDPLDIDRYTVEGETQDYVVALRELNSAGLTGNQTDWINRHLVYTHGNGIVLAPANQVDEVLDENAGEGGLPEFTSIDTSNADAQNALGLQVDEPRIYYGELIDQYSIVGAEEGGTPREYDSDVQSYTYEGQGGVSLGNIVNRAVFALHYAERNILFNNSINDNSKIMYVRDPRDRVEAVAPWLTPDTDPYPAVIDGRIQWIVDGYTTLENYPYAESVALGDATADALQPLQRPQLDKEVSYLRNSVKATVDAYDGTVTLYAFDESDPVLRTWTKAFPDTVEPASAISPELREHFRYPEDQFKVQRELLTEYHVDNPIEFYGNVSFWDVPSDPTVQGGGGTAAAPQPPYYVLAGLPTGEGQTATPVFQLTSALVFRDRDIMSAYMTVSSEPETYGQIKVLSLPAEPQTLGPQQVQTRFVGTPEVSANLGLLSRGGQSTIDYGNLLTLPVGGGLLFVEPVYIERANQESSYPQLARVLVFYNGRVGYSPSVAEALEQVFGAGAGAAATDTSGDAPDTGAPAPDAGTGAGTPSPDLAAAAAEIDAALGQVRSAQQSGDLGSLGEALEALDTAVQRFQQANGQAPAPTPVPAPGG
ncbi:UPF0182 family protein [Pseudonocardia nigra]|uniref:UPF0182 family protein n=1 Tax=Pseudonocardia nigra TaxID=1921578 RepID=UPI001C5F96BE|nr:UPF0182 family protein [Pseudonocardia nigra]